MVIKKSKTCLQVFLTKAGVHFFLNFCLLLGTFPGTSLAEVDSLKILAADFFLMSEYVPKTQAEREELDQEMDKNLPEDFRKILRSRIPMVEKKLKEKMLPGWKEVGTWWGGKWGERCYSHYVYKICQYISKTDAKYDHLLVRYVKDRLTNWYTPPKMWIKVNGIDIGSRLLEMHISRVLWTNYQFAFEFWANSNESYIKELFGFTRRENDRIVNAWDIELAFESEGAWDSWEVDEYGNGHQNYRMRFDEVKLW